MTPPSLQSTIDASCARLESTAAVMGVNLRREVGSVQDLEEILVALLDIEADESALSGATFMVGTYLGEILRASLGGAWRNSQDGELWLDVGKAAYSPISKARRFALNPKGPDGLVLFAQAVLGREA
jgi:hypothetical protein